MPYTGRPNAFAWLNPFIFEGPLTRTGQDAALALDVLSGYDARDPFSLDEQVSFNDSLHASIAGWRIAYTSDFGTFPVDPRVAAVVEAAVRSFEQAGAIVDVVDVDLGYDQRELSDLWARLIIPLNIDGLEGRTCGGSTRANAPRGQRRGRQHAWTERHQRRRGRPAHRLVPDLPAQLHGTRRRPFRRASSTASPSECR